MSKKQLVWMITWMTVGLGAPAFCIGWLMNYYRLPLALMFVCTLSWTLFFNLYIIKPAVLRVACKRHRILTLIEESRAAGADPYQCVATKLCITRSEAKKLVFRIMYDNGALCDDRCKEKG